MATISEKWAKKGKLRKLDLITKVTATACELENNIVSEQPDVVLAK